MPSDDLSLLLTQIDAEVRAEPGEWPGGYPGEIEACLLDAVLSIRARYGASAGTGVRRRVREYRTVEDRGDVDDLAVLAAKSEAACCHAPGSRS